jgi:glucose-1-phosphate thymidylyltransferase
VIGPEHDAVREHYGAADCRRLDISFAVQQEPKGTADAVAAAESFADGDPVLVINGDNRYPAEPMCALRETDGNGLVAFERDAFIAQGNIPAGRVTRFAVVRIDADGQMADLHEKPDEATLASLPDPIFISMNCWRFEPCIFDACRAIEPSPRGEYEITDAVRHVMTRLGRPFRAITYRGSVLDLSCRGDVASVKERLAGVKVSL